ncbi:hypothetical protein M3I53_05945 [Paraburkholderia sp. CNPSo 3272]|uniref:hypothetical protein n=1 Tax=Paraburkholderia sp. CNPSo 3272 TaxID=2940931 RepID=UPI0020B6E399|nr:hypothetical protein [Paraburkholderia sp. CNPSo 3272]MCP3722678.1 hypothetical protein [Paraburkholderia sp. CNPSo 3272]
MKKMNGIMIAEPRRCTLSPRIYYMKEIADHPFRAQLFSIIFSAYNAIRAPLALNALREPIYTDYLREIFANVFFDFVSGSRNHLHSI